MDKLTVRQTEVLNLVARGMSYKEIGVALHLSECTVKYHMERIMELLRLENKAQVIAYAAQGKTKSRSLKSTAASNIISAFLKKKCFYFIIDKIEI